MKQESKMNMKENFQITLKFLRLTSFKDRFKKNCQVWDECYKLIHEDFFFFTVFQNLWKNKLYERRTVSKSFLLKENIIKCLQLAMKNARIGQKTSEWRVLDRVLIWNLFYQKEAVLNAYLIKVSISRALPNYQTCRKGNIFVVGFLNGQMAKKKFMKKLIRKCIIKLLPALSRLSKSKNFLLVRQWNPEHIFQTIVKKYLKKNKVLGKASKFNLSITESLF